MKPFTRIIILLIINYFWVLWPAPGMAQERPRKQELARPFIDALEAYKNDDFNTAIDGFTAIVQSGVENGKLYYNLGNAYLKNNDLGSAILWYERALNLIPNDPDLQFNYQFARSLTRDATEEDVSWVRILFFWKYQLSRRTVILTTITLNLLFWLALGAWRFTRRRGLRRIAIAVAVPALVFALTAGYNYYESAFRRQAIVLPAQTAVRSGLQAESTELFKLHAGAKVTVLKMLRDHFQIRFSKDKIGWVPQEDIGLIP